MLIMKKWKIIHWSIFTGNLIISNVHTHTHMYIGYICRSYTIIIKPNTASGIQILIGFAIPTVHGIQ